MTFVSDVPISGDTLGSTRDRIRGNFQQIALVEAINHVAFNDAGQGKHKFLQMPEQPGTIGQVGVPLPPITLANEAGFYSKIGANPAEANLVFRGENNGAEYQLTSADQTNNATFGTYTAYDITKPAQIGGWTFLPGGLIMQYGTNNFTSGNTKTTAYPKAFSQIFSLSFNLVTPVTATFSWINSITNNNFQIKCSVTQSTGAFYWTAIGLA